MNNNYQHQVSYPNDPIKQEEKEEEEENEIKTKETLPTIINDDKNDNSYGQLIFNNNKIDLTTTPHLLTSLSPNNIDSSSSSCGSSLSTSSPLLLNLPQNINENNNNNVYNRNDFYSFQNNKIINDSYNYYNSITNVPYPNNYHLTSSSNGQLWGTSSSSSFNNSHHYHQNQQQQQQQQQQMDKNNVSINKS
jgi:hypothetical protein